MANIIVGARITETEKRMLSALTEYSEAKGEGEYLGGLIRREFDRIAKESQARRAVRKVAEEFGLPDHVAASLQRVEDLEQVLQSDRFEQFKDKVYRVTTSMYLDAVEKVYLEE